MTDGERTRPLPVLLAVTLPDAASEATLRRRQRMALHAARRELRHNVLIEVERFLNQQTDSESVGERVLYNRVWSTFYKGKRTRMLGALSRQTVIARVRAVYEAILSERHTSGGEGQIGAVPPPLPPPLPHPVITATVSGVPAYSESPLLPSTMRLPDDVTIESIERMFLDKGVGESGRLCQICNEPKKLFINFSKACEHQCCIGCYATYLGVSMETKPFPILCPGCVYARKDFPNPIDPELVVLYANTSRLAENSEKRRELISRFNKLQLVSLQKKGSVVASKACSLCGFTGYCDMAESLFARCCNPLCAAVFCQQCGEKAHVGQTCEQYMALRLAAEKPGETAAYIDKTTKNCPKCGLRIQHFQYHGCHHITCKCKHVFCWLCMAPYPGASKKTHAACPIMCHLSCGCVECDVCKPGVRCPACTGCLKCNTPKSN